MPQKVSAKHLIREIFSPKVIKEDLIGWQKRKEKGLTGLYKMIFAFMLFNFLAVVLVFGGYVFRAVYLLIKH